MNLKKVYTLMGNCGESGFSDGF